ncbi:hypothetical protein AJ79_07950 [Helicocarpus griseus UAMH5409]|uniref:Uncharacterized protein n=1 Tax=Helicocarpus griseus UAMH5409 TaxID=1447875 RepID=A0A2B7WXM5_9EURO|nr:hypothetical protein AJ79_07950 [Helicocarpus griseus UAMH5409]
MPFYSFAVYRGNDGKYSGSDGLNLLITPDRETADRFYRFLQTYPDTKKYTFHNFERHSAQMWTFWGDSQNDLRDFIVDMWQRDFPIPDERFRSLPDTVCIAQYDTNQDFNKEFSPIITHIHLADHVNNGEFFIRRKRHPGQLWYLDGSWIRVSEKQRTKFRIELVDKDTHVLGTPLLIGTDEVRIVALNPSSTNTIKADSRYDGALGTSGDRSTFKFGAFHQGFNVELGRKDELEYVTYVYSDRLLGEEWELVH